MPVRTLENLIASNRRGDSFTRLVAYTTKQIAKDLLEGEYRRSFQSFIDAALSESSIDKALNKLSEAREIISRFIVEEVRE